MAERVTFLRTADYMLIGSDSGGYVYRAEGRPIIAGERVLSVEFQGTRQSFRRAGDGVAVEFPDRMMRAWPKGPDSVDVTIAAPVERVPDAATQRAAAMEHAP